MYETHFGFSAPPFQLNPDPSFYFESQGHGKALSYLRYGVQQGEGFIVITGEVGAGKTTLVRALLQQLDAKDVVAAQLSNTQLEATELLQAILTAFGVSALGLNKAGMITRMEAFLTGVAASGRRALLVVDEAQNLSPQAIEELRMLSNFQLDRHALLQSFLVGQPELRDQLQRPSMEQLRQRVLASYHLGPLAAQETTAYVLHRLRRVGWKNRPRLDDAALVRLHQRTGGIPRRINLLCNRLLLAAYLADHDVIAAALVDETADELGQEVSGPSPIQARPASPEPAGLPVGASSPALAAASPEPSMETPAAASVPVVAKSEGRMLRPVPTARSTAEAMVSSRAMSSVGAAGSSAATAAAAPAADPTSKARSAAQISGEADQSSLPAEQQPGIILALANDAWNWSKFELLGRRWCAVSGLPPMVLASCAERESVQTPGLQAALGGAALATVFLERAHGPLGRRTAALNLRFADLLSQRRPRAMLTAGVGYETLQCALLARQLGIPLIRMDAGDFGHDPVGVPAQTAEMLDRCADLLCVKTVSEQRSLVGQGIASERIVRVGHWGAGVLHALAPRISSADVDWADRDLQALWRSRAAGGYGLITAQIEPGDLAPEDVQQWLMLVRHGHTEIPMIWSATPRTAVALSEPPVQAQLRAAGIEMMCEADPARELSVLAHARCVIAGPARGLVEQAQAVGVPSIVVHLYGKTQTESETSAVVQVGPSASQFKSALRAAVQANRSPTKPADLDDSAAQHAVQQIAAWLDRKSLVQSGSSTQAVA